MRRAPVAKAKARFGTYLKRCEEGPVIITKSGRPAAALIAVPDE